MSVEALLLVGVLAIQALFLAILLFRRAPPDPALATCQSTVERQGERLGELAADLRGLPERVQALIGPAISGFTVEQTKALAALQQGLGDRLAEDARAGRAEQGTKLEELRAAHERMQHALAQGALDQGAALARMEAALLERLATDAKTSRAEQAERLEKLREATDGLTGKVTAALAQQEKAVLECLAAEANASRDLLDRKLKEMAETSEKRLGEIQRSVHEQLAGAVEKQMNESFQRVLDQFAAIQQMMGNVQSVATQVGDLKRLFGNIKTRGGWGEAQLKQMLDDFLPPGAYETNVKLREDSLDVVEFCIRMPGGEDRVLLPLDAKFPCEDYERLILAHEAGDAAEEARARKALEMRVRGEAAKIASKYICPPRSTDYALMFLPTEGLYAEIARMPGLIEDLARNSRIYVAGPFMLPVMLKNIQLGYVQYALSKNAEGVQKLLSATKGEMRKMNEVLEKLDKQVSTVGKTIGEAKTRTRVIDKKLRAVDVLPDEQGTELLQLDAMVEEEEEA
ncbi:DNA recombination protein RmuC [Sabulicella glaciei]|uniref:DNA recombination protein RmuC homolog n=1 Tax=Sabulicella glaciei TaxID=2984948 RepID=A0ABT3NYX4_9PROT|nr:DNA recombination protein RmuC [Roseococcus sp. MDT2-1-1]MCW8087113.1 DNA recombination protein RmuC [Roseococcus sp. MDT2-1-1]